MRSFYDVMKNKISAGQYKMEEILTELQLAYEKNYISLEQVEGLKLLAEDSIDPNYRGNKYPTHYDLDQDLKMALTEESVLELFEILMGTVQVQTASQREKIAVSFNAITRSAIGDLYLKHVLEGRRKFSEVHESKQEEVAEKLISMSRCDLIDVESYHPPHQDCIYGNVPDLPLTPIEPPVTEEVPQV